MSREVSDASGTLLLDVVRRDWSKSLLSKLDLDSDLLPRVVESEEVTGTLTPQAAKLLGLTTECKVVGGAGDCAAGAVGNGVVKQGILSTSIGTSGVMFVHSDQPQYDAAGRLHTFCHAVKGKWHMMGVNLTSGGSLQWWVDSVLQGLSRSLGEESIRGRHRRGDRGRRRKRRARLPALPQRRADASCRPQRARQLRRHEPDAHPRAPHPQRDGGHHLRASRQPGDHSVARRSGAPDPRLGRRQQESVLATDASRCLRQEDHNAGSRTGPGLRGRLAGGGRRWSISDRSKRPARATIKVADETPPDRAAVKNYNRIFPIYQDLYGQLKDSMHALAQIQCSTLIA